MLDRKALASMASNPIDPIDGIPNAQTKASTFLIVGYALGKALRSHRPVDLFAGRSANLAETSGELIRALVPDKGSAALSPRYQLLRFHEF